MLSNGQSGETSSRREIDMAIGILMGLRHCCERQAFDAIATAVRETGMSLGSLCRGLVEMAGGASASADIDPRVRAVWRDLVCDNEDARTELLVSSPTTSS
jgi:ANTAR domain-containing protein